ncbi:MAG: hypothetical protein IJ326_02795 [Lachnospiraceae bacterium]|nr:hypothetical protein [Lachnospiraceae bacterium]
MKKWIYSILIFLCLIVVAFQWKEKSKEVVLEKEEFCKYSYTYNPDIWSNLRVNVIEFETPINSSCGNFCVYQDKVYYLVDFSDYMTNKTETDAKEFAPEYNTQVRVYDSESGEDKILYQYHEERCINVTDIRCNGRYVIWEEYVENTWNIRCLELEILNNPKVIVSSEEGSGGFWSITPNLIEDNLYWYDQNRNGSTCLKQYNIQSGKTDVVVEECDLASPYEHVAIDEGIITTYRANKIKGYDIVSNEVDTFKQVQYLSCDSTVCKPISDRTRCIWSEGNELQPEKIYSYVFENEEKEVIEIEDLFSYALLDQYMIVNSYGEQEGLYCYDLINKQYGKLELLDNNTIMLFTFQSSTGDIYCEIVDKDTIQQPKLKILHVTIK